MRVRAPIILKAQSVRDDLSDSFLNGCTSDTHLFSGLRLPAATPRMAKQDHKNLIFLRTVRLGGALR